MHSFEAANLGKAPFQLRRHEYDPERNSFCDHCGTRIKHRFVVEDKIGRESVVGSTCVQQADAGLYKDCQNELAYWKDREAMSEEQKKQEDEFYSGFERVK